jgi:hypothetical protein
MDPEIEDLIVSMADADRDQLAADMDAWAGYHGVDLTDELAEQYVREAFAADHDGQAPEEFEEVQPVEEVDPAAFFSGYAARSHAHAELSDRARLAEQRAEQDAADFEHELGRTLTERERDALEDAQRAQFQRGESVNVHGAAWTAGIKHWNEMSEHEVTATMEERAREMSGDEPDFEIPAVSGPTVDHPLQPDWSSMDSELINRYMVARLNGGGIDEGG